ncbi:hypothetical protein MMC29_000856, partial [Sticta canariensis]|nr:hypothetical protein [Sticta canariensis]
MISRTAFAEGAQKRPRRTILGERPEGLLPDIRLWMSRIRSRLDAPNIGQASSWSEKLSQDLSATAPQLGTHLLISIDDIHSQGPGPRAQRLSEIRATCETAE